MRETACTVTVHQRCEVRLEMGRNDKGCTDRGVGGRVRLGLWLYLVRTMAISGLILSPSPRRAITLPCKTRPINSSPLSLGNGAPLNTAPMSQPIHTPHTCIHTRLGEQIGLRDKSGVEGGDHRDSPLLGNRPSSSFSMYQQSSLEERQTK